MSESIIQNSTIAASNINGNPKTRPGNLFTEQISHEYHNNEKTRYYIPTTTLGAPENRKLKVITIGAGISGIMLAHDIERDCQNVEHVIYEKNGEVGGTWVLNFVYLCRIVLTIPVPKSLPQGWLRCP